MVTYKFIIMIWVLELEFMHSEQCSKKETKFIFIFDNFNNW